LIDATTHFNTTPNGQELIDEYTEVFPINFEALYIVDEKTDWQKIIYVDTNMDEFQVANSMVWLGKIKHQAMANYRIEYK
jgi:hypothetical protein